MAKTLTDAAIRAIDKPGRVAVGGGLYVRTRDNGTKSFVLIMTVGGKRYEEALGTYPEIRLRQAQEKAEEARQRIKSGLPKTAPETKPVLLFGDFATEVIDGKAPGFNNAKHLDQWRNTIKTYCVPILQMRVDEIGVADVLKCISPIWTTKAETASRVRGRIERVMDAAIALGHRDKANPATVALLKELLPKRQKLQRGHHAALPYADMPAFWTELSALTSVSAEALRFLILTAARSGEVRGATWDEIDGNVWTVPAARMKAKREHRVPLTDEAMSCLKSAKKLSGDSGLIFPGASKSNPLSDMALAECLKGLRPGFTVHGMRSTFRDWAGEETDYAREIAEAALAHAVGDAVERAYRRGDALEKRRPLMADWAAFVTGSDGDKSNPVNT